MGKELGEQIHLRDVHGLRDHTFLRSVHLGSQGKDGQKEVSQIWALEFDDEDNYLYINNEVKHLNEAVSPYLIN